MTLSKSPPFSLFDFHFDRELRFVTSLIMNADDEILNPTAGLMAMGLRKIRHRQHTVYDKEVGKESLEVLFDKLQIDGKLPYGFIPMASEVTGVPEDTIKHWRKKLKVDHDWRPRHGSPGVPKLLTAEQEEKLKKNVQETYIYVNKYLSGLRLKLMAFDTWRNDALKSILEAAGEEGEHVMTDAVQKQVDEVMASAPKFSDHWKERFERRQGLTERVPHMKKRSDPKDNIVACFLQDFELAQMQYPKSHIYNVDETSWRIVNGKLKTVCMRGSDEVRVEVGFDVKEAVTVMAGCSADGKKLPLMLIATGTTERCEDKYRQDPRLRRYIDKSIFIDHTSGGWADADFAKRYIKFVHKAVKKDYIYLIWDLHASHRSESVKEYAPTKKVYLSFIPAGQTGTWQPLDRRLFGIIKKQAKMKFEELAMRKDLRDIDMIDALVIFVNIWNNLDEAQIRSSWKYLTE